MSAWPVRQLVAEGPDMSSEASDLSLVQLAQKGDAGAFDALVRRYQHKVVKLVMRYVRDPAEAEDVAQEAFIKAYRALPRFRGEEASGWRGWFGQDSGEKALPPNSRHKGTSAAAASHP